MNSNSKKHLESEKSIAKTEHQSTIGEKTQTTEWDPATFDPVDYEFKKFQARNQEIGESRAAYHIAKNLLDVLDDAAISQATYLSIDVLEKMRKKRELGILK